MTTMNSSHSSPQTALWQSLSGPTAQPLVLTIGDGPISDACRARLLRVSSAFITRVRV